jgi:hypothetical protein
VVKLKAWESMTNAERAEQTYRDIKLTQERRRIGVREADTFMFTQINNAKKKRDKIISKKYRRRW